jgi:hypothetical protein
MSNLSLQTLTWGTVVAAIASALWLAAGDSGLGDARAGYGQMDRATTGLPSEPTAAGSATRPGAANGHRAHRAPRKTPPER